MPAVGDASSDRTPSPRLDLAQQFMSHIGHRDFDSAMSLLAPDATYRVLGNSSLSGVFSGRADVTTHLTRLVERTNETFDTVNWEDWMVGASHVAALVTVQAQSRGMLYHGRAIFLSKFRVDDKIEEFIVFFEDEAGVTRFLGM